MPKLQNPIQMAVIGAPHGIRGELRIKSFTADALALADYGPLFAEDGRRFDITDIRPAKTVVVVRLKQVKTREDAEALTGTMLFVERAQLPDDLEDEEFYHADLVGLAVQDTEGLALGRINAFHNFGGGDLMEVALSSGGTVLIPFTLSAVPAVDMAARVVTVDQAAAGLLDTGEREEDEAEFDPSRQPRGPKDAGGNR